MSKQKAGDCVIGESR